LVEAILIWVINLTWKNNSHSNFVRANMRMDNDTGECRCISKFTQWYYV